MEYASSSPSQGETAQAPCSDQQQSSVALSKAENTLTSIDTEKRDPNKLKRSRSGSSKPELEDDESHAKSAKTSSTATNTATTARNKSLDEAEEATLPEAASSTDNTSPRKYGIIPITPTSMLGKGKHSRAVEDISKMEGTLVASLSSDLAINLPGHISNLFASKTIRVTPCQCLESQCAQDCITSAYLDAYGWEYRSLLREAEEQEFNRDKYDQQLPEKSLGLAPLVSARILPPLEKRFREHTEWSGPRSIKWDLSNYIDRQPELAPRMRGILVDWIVELSEEYKLSPTTFHLAITLIDKALASKPLFYIQKELLQCLGCACTWIAAKIEEIVPPSLDDFVYISDNIYTRGQIAQMETDVCEVLKFRLHHATPVKFVHEYLLASQDGMQTLAYEVFHPMLRSMVYYLLELSRMSYELVPTRPSLVAAAAVFLGRATLGIRCQESETADSNGFWTKTLEFYTQYTVEQLKSTVQVLLHYHRGAEEASLHAVFSKYNKAKFTYVATKTALSLPELGLDN